MESRGVWKSPSRDGSRLVPSLRETWSTTPSCPKKCIGPSRGSGSSLPSLGPSPVPTRVVRRSPEPGPYRSLPPAVGGRRLPSCLEGSGGRGGRRTGSRVKRGRLRVDRGGGHPTGDPPDPEKDGTPRPVEGVSEWDGSPTTTGRNERRVGGDTRTPETGPLPSSKTHRRVV